MRRLALSHWLTCALSFLIGGAVAVIAGFAALMHFAVGSVTASRVTKAGFLGLRPGMTTNEVLDVIGAPLSEHHYYATRFGSHRVNAAGEMLWQYAAPGFMDSGFAAYVSFKDDIVVWTEIKYNDFGVYSCSKDKCPEIVGDERVLDRLPKTQPRDPTD